MFSLYIDALHTELFKPGAKEIAMSPDSMYYMHLREHGSNKSLCGLNVISTKRDLSEWGTFERGIHWCNKCSDKR